MHKSLLSFSLIPQLSKTDLAYAMGDADLAPFYRWKPEAKSFAALVEARRAASDVPRTDLAAVLQKQYAALPRQEAVERHIAALAQPDTYTVVTAHQPSLFLGPLYFIYKAISTINLAQAIGKQTGKHVAPVFVLGSEDHDLEELNHATLYGKKIVWAPGETGAVGNMRTGSLRQPLEELRAILGDSDAARHWYERVEKACLGAENFAGATQALLHDLLGRFGLVVLNMSDPALKRHFIPVLRDELLHQTSSRIVGDTIARLNALGFKTQAVPRDINLFYLEPGSRERIVLEDGMYKVLNTGRTFTPEAILEEVEQHPERFSPNVVLRPLYQEMILPNLAYVGGGGELAYWLERKDLFEHFKAPFPMLVRRNSVLWLDRDALKRLAKFGLPPTRLFEDTDSLVRAFVSMHAAAEVNLHHEIVDLQHLFDRLAGKAAAIDPTLEKAVRADEVKFRGALEQWQSRLVRAEKQKHETSLNQLRALKEKLFPGNGLQERTENVLPFLLKYGEHFLDVLINNLDPMESGFVLLEDQ